MGTTRWVTRSSATTTRMPWVAMQVLQPHQAESLGLEPGSSHAYRYASRPFECLGYAIQPMLHCDLEATADGLVLYIHGVSIAGLGVLERWVQLQGRIQLKPAAQTTVAEQWLELSLGRRGPLAWAPQHSVSALADSLLEQMHERMQRALSRRMAAAMQAEASAPA
jgi:hypothetical protein